LITMPRIMIDHGYQFRLKPRWIHAPRSDSYPIGQRLVMLEILTGATIASDVILETENIY
jgi:hypothetical protein